MFASSGVESEIAAQAERLEVLPGIRIPVARTGHLIAVKILARDDEQRPQDYADIRALLSVTTSADIELASSTVDLITRRGFNRDRDLVGALELLLEKYATQP